MPRYACLEDSLIISVCDYVSIRVIGVNARVNGLRDRWQAFYQEVVRLVTAGERHYGVYYANYNDYMIERFELSIQSCETIVNDLYAVLSNAERAVTEYRDYIDLLIELLAIYGYCRFSVILHSICISLSSFCSLYMHACLANLKYFSYSRQIFQICEVTSSHIITKQ